MSVRTGPPSDYAGPVVPMVRVHERCGRPLDQHPHGQTVGCAFPERPPIEFATAEAEPRVRVVGLPTAGPIPREVMAALDHLAEVCRATYGLTVEVLADDTLDEVREALDTIRRRLDL